MSKPHYYDELTDKLQDLREYEITCSRYGYLVIKCLSEDLIDVQEMCEELMNSEDYHIETC